MEQIVAYVDARRDRFLDDLAALVNVDCGTRNKAGVDAVGAAMRRRLEQAGFAVETVPVDDYGDFLVGRMSGSGKARILIVGHLDTVYEDGTVGVRPCTIAGDRVTGPGVADMKAGLVCGLHAVDALRATGFDDFAEIVFFCNSEEEVGSPASAGLCAKLASNADAAFVLEAGRADGSIVSARKGGARYEVRVTGRSAHSGVDPENGASAVHELAHHTIALAALNGFTPGATVNVGRVAGGSRANVVADAAEAQVDVRVVGRADVESADAAVRRVLDKRHVPGTSTAVTTRGWKYPMDRTPAVNRLLELARGVAGEIGFALTDVATGGMSDGNNIAAAGTPVLDGLGPVGGRYHSPEEYLELDSIAPRTALLAGLVRAACQSVDELRALAAEGRRRQEALAAEGWLRQ